MKTNVSNSALIVFMALTLILSACGAIAPAATATALPSATATNTALPTFTPTVTLTPTRTPKPTATPNMTATQQYDDFFSIVQRYYDDGVLPTLKGRYQIMGDFSDQSTDAGTYRWETYDDDIGSFIVRADIVLEKDHSPASQSGCGFVFGISNNYQEFVFLQRNGSAIYGIGGRPFTTKYYEQLQNPAEFNMVIIALDKDVRLIINDKEVIKIHLDNHDRNRKEAWGPALLAGSTQDFGTRCAFKNIELWEISDS